MTNKILDSDSTHINKLIDFGLTKNEARIYIALLENGKELGGTKIALLGNIHRQYLYGALPRLLKLGLVQEVGNGNHKKYRAMPPTEIEKLGRKRALESSDLAKELNMISNIGNEQDFEVLQGKKAIQEYELQYAFHAIADSSEYIIGGASELFTSMMGDSLDEYLETKTAKHISVKYIGTLDEEILYTKYMDSYKNQQYRFMKNLPKGKTHMVIREDTVSFFSFLNPPLVYIVKSSEIAQNYRNFFMMLWEMAKKDAT